MPATPHQRSAGLIPEPFRIEYESIDETALRIVLHGELDTATVGTLADSLATVERWERVVLDLRRLSFIDSSGICTVLRAHEHMRSRQAGLELVVEPSSAVERTIRLTTADQLLDVTALPLAA